MAYRLYRVKIVEKEERKVKEKLTLQAASIVRCGVKKWGGGSLQWPTFTA
jgi:hypothetical protein